MNEMTLIACLIYGVLLCAFFGAVGFGCGYMRGYVHGSKEARGDTP